jgi:hypothetical protein
MEAEFKQPILSVVNQVIGYMCFALAALIGITGPFGAINKTVNEGAQIIAASLLLAVGLAVIGLLFLGVAQVITAIAETAFNTRPRQQQ